MKPSSGFDRLEGFLGNGFGGGLAVFKGEKNCELLNPSILGKPTGVVF